MHDFEAAIGYRFQNTALLENALTHSSYANENRAAGIADNERLEFLGDSVLGFVTAEHLFYAYPGKPEGELTRIRADLVCERNLAKAARSICLGEHLRLGCGEDNSGGRNRDSILSDAMEAVFAAVYLDGGIAEAKALIEKLILADTKNAAASNADYKTMFQELVQRKKNQTIIYEAIGESGPDHDKQFDFRVLLNGKTVGTGSGSSKKRAEQAAARNAIEKLYPNEL